MRKKNEIEQELDKKELESELHRDINSQYASKDVLEKFFEDRNPYVLGLMNFLFTLVFFEVLYFLLKALITIMTLGFANGFFSTITPYVHIAILGLCIASVIKRRSAVEVVIDRWPF